MSHCSRSLALVIALTVVACLAGTMTALATPCLAGTTGVPAGRSPEGLSAEALLAQAEKELQADPKVADPVRFYCELLYFRLQKGDKAGYKQALAKAREALEKFAATDPKGFRPREAWMALAVSQVKAGDVSGGKDTALWLKDTADSGALVEALAAAGDLDGAIKVARASRIHGWSSWARVATYLVHTGRVEEAEKTIADLPDSYRHGILEEILMAHARAGDAEKFQKTLPEVQRLLETDRIGIDLYDYVRVAAALAVMGDKKGFDWTMRQAKDFAGTMTPGRRLDPEFVVWQYTAAALGRAGKMEEATEALAHLKSPNSHKWFVIQALAARGDPEKAEALGPDDLANLHLAVAWFKKGNTARYQELIRKDIARAEGMKGWSDRHGDFGEMELGRVARAQLLVGDWEGAKQTMADSAFAGTKVLNRYVATGIAWGWAASGKTEGLWEWLDQFKENADRPFVYLAAAEGAAGQKTNLMGSFDDERLFDEFSIWAAIEDPPVQPQPAAPPYREVNVPPVWADSADGRYRVTVGSVRRGFQESRSPVPMSISLDFHRVDLKSHESIIDFWLKPSAIVDEGSTIQVKGPGGEDLKATDTSWARFGSWDVEVPDGVTRLAEVRLRLPVFTPSEWKTFEFRDLGKKESTPRNLGPVTASFGGRKTEFYALLWCSKPEDEAYKAWQARTGLRVVPLDVILSTAWTADATGKPLKAVGGGLEDAQSGRRKFGDEGQTGGKWVWNEIKYPIRASVEVPEAGTVRSVEFVLKDMPLPGPDVGTLLFSPETAGQPPPSALETLKVDSLREADAFLSEEVAPQGMPFDVYKYETRAGRLMALLAGADKARADKVLRQAVKTLEAQEALAGHPFSFNSVEAGLLKTAAEKCHSLDGLRYSVERLSTAKQHQLSLFDDLARTFSPVLSQAMEVKQTETRAVRGTPVARVVPLAEALMELNRKFGGALVPGTEECLAALTRESGGVPLSDVERKALVAMFAKAPKSRFLEAARFGVEAAAAAAEASFDTPLPPSPECIGFYRQVLEDESLAPMWRASVYWQVYHSRRLTRSRVATVFPDPEAADNELAPARAVMVKAAGLAASSATRIERRDISLLLDELNTAPVTLEWKAAAAPLVDAWKTATRSQLSRERQGSPNDHIDEYERDQALAVLESCLKLGDRTSAEWLLAETAFQLGRWPETYGVLAESPWADLVSQTLAKNAKDIEIVAWYHSGGMSPRILMTAARRQAADQMIRAIALPDVAYLAEALYAAMPVIGPVEEGRYGLGPHPTRIHQKRLIDLAEEFPKLKFEDAGLREKALELLLARPTWWRLKDELFAWGAKQKPANVSQAGMRDLRGGRLMEQYAACLVLLVNDGKPEPAMRALEVIRAELRIPNHEAPHRVINDIRLSLWALLTVQPDSFYRAMPFPLAREAGDYIEFARAVCLSEDRCNDSNHDLGEAVMALYAAAGRAGEMARFSEEFAAKTGQRDPQNAALGSREPLRIDLSVFERLLQSVPPEKHVETVGRLFAGLEKAGINARALLGDLTRGYSKAQPLPLLTVAINKWWAGQIESLRKQVAENSTDNNALGNLIAACEATGDFRSAIELFPRWHGTTEDAGRWGRFLYNQEHAEEIGDALVECAGKWPEKRWGYLHDASEAYLRANRNGKAVTAVLDAFAADPADPNVQSKVLRVLMKCHEYEFAVAVGERSLSLRPEPPKSSPDTTREQWLGEAYTELGRVDEAIAMYRRALAAANPGSDLFLGLLRSASDLLVKQGKFGEAVRMCQDGLRSTKDPERRLWIQGMIIDAFTAAKQQDKVIEAAGEGLRMCQSLPDSVTSSYVTKWATARGRACLFLKQYDEAMKMAAMAQAGDLTWQIQEALLTETGLEVPAGASAPSGG